MLFEQNVQIQIYKYEWISLHSEYFSEREKTLF